MAEGLATVGRLPLLGALTLAGGGPTGEPGGNSAFRLAGVWGRLVVGAALADAVRELDGPVLLVDDLASSRWTLTVAASALCEAGADEVLPFVLALDGLSTAHKAGEASPLSGWTWGSRRQGRCSAPGRSSTAGEAA